MKAKGRRSREILHQVNEGAQVGLGKRLELVHEEGYAHAILPRRSSQGLEDMGQVGIAGRRAPRPHARPRAEHLEPPAPV